MAPAHEQLLNIQWGHSLRRISIQSGERDGAEVVTYLLLGGTAPASALARPANDRSVVLLFNAWLEPVEFTLPDRPRGQHWVRMVDSALGEQEETLFEPRAKYVVTPRSMLMFASDA
jgi:hypothetical protein